MLEKYILNFKNLVNIDEGIKLIHECVINKLYYIGYFIGLYLLNIFPNNFHLIIDTGLCAYNSNKYIQCYDLFSNKLKKLHNLSQTEVDLIKFNQKLCSDNVLNRYIDYNTENILKIKNQIPNKLQKITFSITTCKRFDLFEKTINSFINCCTDSYLIDKWICVDDNSSIEDQNKMKEQYPFFKFYFKKSSEKGHPQSMNIIKKLVTTPYLFHMEDDWQFYEKNNYIQNCLEIVNENSNYGQCLINKNYSEIPNHDNIKGGIMKLTHKGIRYYEHEHYPNQEDFNKKYGSHIQNCAYWPHFSFRPSLIKTHILYKLGDFNTIIGHFEMEYSNRYYNSGFKSVFLENIYCKHIGRLTSERHNKNIPNAYELNNESQFIDKNDNQKSEPIKLTIKTIIINLENRPDRFTEFTKNAPISQFLKYNRFPAIYGKNLITTPQLLRIFDGNDYNMRCGLVGCALSHIKLYIDLVKDPTYNFYIILEDDITFTPDFDKKLLHILPHMVNPNINIDMIYLGHHMFPKYRNDNIYNKETLPSLFKWSSQKSLQMSMGGTGGYIISKNGARKLLEFINKFGMTNGIDTVQQKSADLIDIYYTEPHLIFSECYLDDQNKPNSDIQYDHYSLSIPFNIRLEDEFKFYRELNNQIEELITFNDVLLIITKSLHTDKTNNVYYFKLTPFQIHIFNSISEVPLYDLNNKILFIVPNPHPTKQRYFKRLNKLCEYNIDDAILLKN
jgi:GR25 family glycosyltransferase involved in LPS biosynthesis